MILYVEMKRSLYGGQHALIARCRELSRLGIEYRVVHPWRGSDFGRHFVAKVGTGKMWRPRYKWLSACWLFRALYVAYVLLFFTSVQRCRDEDSTPPIIVHLEGFDSLYVVSFLRLVGFMRRLRLVVTVRSNRYLRLSRFDRTALRRADALLTNSKYSQAALAKALDVPVADIVVAYTPIDFDSLRCGSTASTRPNDNRDARLRIGFVGSFEERKRLDLFIRCVRELNEEAGGLVATGQIFGGRKPTISGAAETGRLTEALAFALQNRETFVFHGYIEPSQIYSEIDVLLCPFENEPFGRVVAEASFAGVAVVVRAEGGMMEASVESAHEIHASCDEEFVAGFLNAVKEASRRPMEIGDLVRVRAALKHRFSTSAVLAEELNTYLAAQPEGVRQI